MYVIVVTSNVLDDGIPAVAKKGFQIGGVYAQTESVVVQEPLNPSIEEKILHMLRPEQAFDKASRFGHIKIVFIHRNKSVERPVAFGVHSQVCIPPVLMGTVHIDPTPAGARKIPYKKIAGVRVLISYGIDGVEHRPDCFGGRMGPFRITQIIALKFGGKGNAVLEATMVGSTDR
jgi:hypothetical protein